MVNCAACKSQVLVTQKRIKCTDSKCLHTYHNDCVNFSNDSPSVRSKWICPECIASRPRSGNNSNTPVRGQRAMENKTSPPSSNEPCSPSPQDGVSESSVRDSAVCSLVDVGHLIKVEISKMRNELEASFKKFIRDELTPLRSELESTIRKFISDELSPLRSQVQEIKDSMEFIDSKYDDFAKRLVAMEDKVTGIATSRAEVKDLKKVINQLENSFNSKEQWGRRSNIEILGIPEKKNENLLEIFKEINILAKTPIDCNTDIDFINRIAPRNNEDKRPKAIVVRFLARYKKDDCLSSLKKLRDFKACDIGFHGSNSNIYFNDHLTSSNKALLKQARTLAKEKAYKYTSWVKNCSIFVRKTDTSPVINIASMEDLKRIK